MIHKKRITYKHKEKKKNHIALLDIGKCHLNKKISIYEFKKSWLVKINQLQSNDNKYFQNKFAKFIIGNNKNLCNLLNS